MRRSSSSTSRSTCSRMRSTCSRHAARSSRCRAVRPAGGLRLHDPLRRRRPHRGRQGQRRAGGAAHRAQERRRGRDRHLAQCATESGVAELRAHRPGRARRSGTTSRTRSRRSPRDLGEKLLAQALRAEGLTLPPAPDEAGAGDTAQVSANSLWQQLTRWSGNRSADDLLVDIGLGRKIATMVAKRMAGLMRERGTLPDALTLTMGRYGADDATPSQGMVVIDGSEGALGAAGTVLPADPRRRHRRLPRPRRRPGGAHRRLRHRPPPVRSRQRALDRGGVVGGAGPQLRDRGAGAGAQRQGRARATGAGGERRRGRHHPHRPWARSPPAKPPSCACCSAFATASTWPTCCGRCGARRR